MRRLLLLISLFFGASPLACPQSLSADSLAAYAHPIEVDSLPAADTVGRRLLPATREEVMAMSYEELLELDLPDLMRLASVAGVSADELLLLAMDRQTSTPSKREESLFDSPLATTVITSEQIQLSGATSIAELMRMVPGLIVREQGPGVYDIHIRGLDNVPPNNYNQFSVNSLSLVMVNGVPQYNYLSGGTFWEALPVGIAEIERIDIIRGGTSALYGASAVSGVINIITKPLPATVTAVGIAHTSLQNGNFTPTITARASLPIVDGLRIGMFQHYQARLMTQETQYNYGTGAYEPYDQLTDKAGRPGAYLSWDAARRMGITSAGIAYNGGKSLETLGIGGEAQYSHYGLDASIRAGYNRSHARAVFAENYVTPFSQRIINRVYADARVAYYGFELLTGYSNGLEDPAVMRQSPISRCNVQSVYMQLEYSNTFWNQLTVRPGFYYQHAFFDNAPWSDEPSFQQAGSGLMFTEQVRYMCIAGMLHLDWNPTEQIRLLLSGRVDGYHMLKQVYPTGQLAFTYKPASNHILRLVAGIANRAPFLLDSYLNFHGNPVRTYAALQHLSTIDPYTYGDVLRYIEGVLPQKPEPDDYVIYQNYLGNPSIKLLTSHQVDLGYRYVYSNRFSLDFELFTSYSYNFSDTRMLGGAFAEQTLPDGRRVPIYTQTMRYETIPLRATQHGTTLTLNYLPIKELDITLFATAQFTKLYNFTSETVLRTDPVSPRGLVHHWTPLLTMGLIAGYRPFDPLHFHLELYFRTKQQYSRAPVLLDLDENFNQTTIPPYLLGNFTVTYDASRYCAIQLSARNLFYGGAEFGFTDRLKPHFLLGVRITF